VRQALSVSVDHLSQPGYKKCVKTEREALKKSLAQITPDQFESLSTAAKWKLLQDFHVQSQPFWLDHSLIHLKMLIHSLRTFQIAEVLVQVFFFLVAAPSSILKMYPKKHPGTITIRSK
jgi:hypothetical protein